MPFKFQFQQQTSSTARTHARNPSYTVSQDKHRRSLHKLQRHLSHPLHRLTPSVPRKRQKHSSPYNRQWRRRREVAVQLYSFFNLGAWWRWVVNARPRPPPPGKEPGTHCTGGWVGLAVVLDSWGKSRPRRGSNSRPSTFSWNVPAFVIKNYLTGTTNGRKLPARFFVYPSLATFPAEHVCSDPLPHTEGARQSLPCWLQP